MGKKKIQEALYQGFRANYCFACLRFRDSHAETRSTGQRGLSCPPPLCRNPVWQPAPGERLWRGPGDSSLDTAVSLGFCAELRIFLYFWVACGLVGKLPWKGLHQRTRI